MPVSRAPNANNHSQRLTVSLSRSALENMYQIEARTPITESMLDRPGFQDVQIDGAKQHQSAQKHTDQHHDNA